MDRHDLIRQRAHAIWESEGRPENRAEEHWKMASVEIENAAAGTEPFEGEPKALSAKTGSAKPGSKSARSGKTAGIKADQKPAAKRKTSAADPAATPEGRPKTSSDVTKPAGNTPPSGTPAVAKSPAKRATKRSAKT